jgi:hypothetical protein
MQSARYPKSMFVAIDPAYDARFEPSSFHQGPPVALHQPESIFAIPRDINPGYDSKGASAFSLTLHTLMESQRPDYLPHQIFS